MAKHWYYFMFMLWISYLIVSGILMFARGFLLTRDTYTDISTCVSQNEIPCTPAASTKLNITNGHDYQCSKENKLLSLLHDIDSASKVCFPKRAKVVLIVIDALRYDFTVFDSKLKNPHTFQNKLPIINDMLTNLPNHTKLYQFIADPPTTTMQRLKALTTGSLPTFIDAGLNFATPEIGEDNLIDQLIRHNHNVVFMGDDTWSGLYPKRFIRNWAFPSFNVWDLDTVDYGIINNLYSEIPKSDWSLLIAHFLGVDHCGHRYGPYHNEMSRKLTEMNDVIRNVINKMDEETVLFVIGDHGMTATGDHGGDSQSEVTSAMFVYSSKPLSSFSSDSVTDSIKQIDLVPTLATVLGIPIPFSNLGSILLEVLPDTNSSDVPFLNWQSYLLALWSNVQQVTNYIQYYSSTTNQFSEEKLDLLNKKFAVLNARVNDVNSEEQLKFFAKNVYQYLTLVREMCEEVWVQFDSFSMSRGLLLTFLTIFFVYMIIDGIPSEKIPKILVSSFLYCSYTMIAAAAVVCYICYYFGLVDNLELTLLFSTGMVSVFMLAMLVVQHWEDIAIQWFESTKMRNGVDVICRLVLILMLCASFSNSYLIEEATVLSFLLLSLVIVVIYNTSKTQLNVKSKFDKNISNAIKFKWSSVKLKLILMGLVIALLLRLSTYFWRCREEQNWCLGSSIHEETLKKSAARKTECIITLVSLALFATVSRIWLRSCGNLVGFSPTVTLARYAPSVIVVCTGGFWILHGLPKETKTRLILPWQTDILAWIVYTLVFLSLLSTIIQPLCLYVLPKQKETVSVYGQENIIPQLFNQVKGLMRDKNERNANDAMPVVYGLGTVYSAMYVVVSVFICLLISLLLGDILAPSSVVMYATTTIVLAVMSIAQYERAQKISHLFDVPSFSILCWVILSHYFFYGTGHQPSFPKIQWEAAFVGTGGSFVHNIIPSTLIGINTFGSYIILGITVPLLLIAPFTLYVMFPNVASKNDEKDLRKGELLLYQNDGLMMNGVLIVSCKYILYHGIRIFACMLAATVHCRHLMVWKIFAPKLIFEAISMMVTLPAVLFGYLLLIRINSKVEKLVIGLDKQNR